MEDLVVGGQRIRFELHGEGEPVVIVANLAMPPGVGPATPALTGAGYQVVTFQHLGPEPSSVMELAEDVGALLDHMSLGPARLWGISGGALIAQEVALLRPDVVRAAAMTATMGRASAYSRLSAAAYESLAGREQELSDVYAYLVALGSMSPAFLANDDRLQLLVDAMKANPFNDDAMRRNRHMFKTFDDRLEALAGISVPCLVIAFERDLMMLPAHGREVADAIPNCHYVEIPGVGHDGVFVRTREVMKYVLDFFSSV